MKESKSLLKQLQSTSIKNAASYISEQMFNDELYAANRAEMRKNEANLSELRYKIEDEILGELTKETAE